MRKISVLVFVAVLIVSCGEKSSNEHLSAKEMEDVLVDIHYAEVYSTMINDSLHKIKHKNKDSLAVFYADILNHHDVTPDFFEQSMTWYENHPGKLEHIYAQVLLRVTTAEGTLQEGNNNKKEE